MITKITLGTVQFGIPYGISNTRGKVDSNEATAILRIANTSGIKTLDTAIAYGDSEVVLGKLLSEKQYTFRIVTKVSASENIRSQIEGSLKRLRQEKLYGVLFHNTDDVFNNLLKVEQLNKLKSEGTIEKIGYSLYNPSQLEKLLALDVNIDLVQIPFNLFDQRFEPYFNELKSQGIEIHVRSVFLQGIFFMNPDKLDVKFEELKLHLKKLHQISKEEDLSVGTIALCFAVINENIDQVVIGVESLKNLEENISSLHKIDKVKAISDKLLNLELNKSRMILPTNWQ